MNDHLEITKETIFYRFFGDTKLDMNTAQSTIKNDPLLPGFDCIDWEGRPGSCFAKLWFFAPLPQESIYHLERVMKRFRYRSGIPKPTDSFCPRNGAIMFVDTKGSTNLLQNDEETGVRILADIESQIESITGQNDGRLVKTLGDGALVVFPNADTAFRASKQLHKEITSRELRIGIDLGTYIDNDGDTRGRLVAKASRLCDDAPPGKTYLSEDCAKEIFGALLDNGKSITRSLKDFGECKVFCI